MEGGGWWVEGRGWRLKGWRQHVSWVDYAKLEIIARIVR